MLSTTKATQKVALKRAGYVVKMAQVMEKGGVKKVVPLLAQGVAVRVMDSNDYFRYPS